MTDKKDPVTDATVHGVDEDGLARRIPSSTENCPQTQRRELPSKRRSIGFNFTCQAGVPYRCMASHFDDGRLAELFLTTNRAGSALQQNADVAAILASLLLQHGVDAETIANTVAGSIAIAIEMAVKP